MDLSTIEKYRVYTEQEQCEPMVAAILVLADAIDSAGYRLNMTDNEGNLNVVARVDVSGELAATKS